MPLSLKVKKSSIILWIVFIMLLFFAGFRWDVGIDWLSYKSIIESRNNFLDELEVGNKLFASILFSLGLKDGRYWLWVMSFFTLFFFFYSIRKYSIMPLFSALLFVSLGFYFDSLNGIRQFLSIALFVYSWQFIISKQPIRYMMIVLIAACFHTSALVLLPVYFFARCTFNRRTLLITFVVIFFLSFAASYILPKLTSILPYEVYTTSKFLKPSENIFAKLRIVFPTILFIISMLTYNSLKKKNIVILNLSLLSILITVLAPSVTLMIRIGFYFQMAFIFLIPLIINTFTLKKNRALFGIFSLIYSFMFIYITQLSRPINKIIPYKLDFQLANLKLFFLLLSTFVIIFLFIKITTPKYNPYTYG